MTERDQVEGQMRAKRPTRFLAQDTVMGLTVVALILLLAPAASGKAVGGSLKAPYPGAISYTYTNIGTQACAGGKAVKLPHWNATTGKGTFSVATIANSCAVQTANGGTVSSGNAGVGYSVALKIAVGGNGHYHFKIYWATHVTTGETLVGGTCNATVSSSSCDAGLGFSVDLSASLYDNTNGTYVSGTGGACWQGGCNNQPSWIEQGYAYNDSSCSSGSCSYNNNSYTTGSPVGNHLTFFINTSWTLLTSHSYMLLMGADGSTYAYCDGFSTQLTGCAATAVVNAATLGNYEKLAFVGWR